MRNIEKSQTTPILSPKDDPQISELARGKKEERQKQGYIRRDSYPLAKLKNDIVEALQKELPLEATQLQLAAVPAKHKGDLALQIPHLMKSDMKTYRTEQLPKIKEILEGTDNLPISGLALVGPFLNITLDPAAFSRQVIRAVLEREERYGEIDIGQEQAALVEYSSPNTGKSLHIGHLGTTLLGHIYGNILHSLGYCVYRISHLGDWGLPIGLLKVAMEEFGEEPEIQALKDDTANYFATLYARIHKESEERPELRERAKEAFARLENQDPEMRAFWNDIRERSMETFESFYGYFDISLDAHIGEAYYEEDLEGICAKIEKLDVARKDGQAIVVELDAVNLGTVLIKKSDGATTYLTRDLAAITKRHDLFGYNRCYYVVGSEQTTHFRQLFHLTKLLGEDYADNCQHIPIGLLQQGGKKISSRKGTALTPEELLEATAHESEKLIIESLPEESPESQKAIAHQIATAAMLYTQVLTTPGKNIEFNLERMLDLKGKTGPYLQYTCVRAKSILRKVGMPAMSLDQIAEETIEQASEHTFPLIKLLAQLPEILEACFQASSPHPLAHYMHELAQAVNLLYQTVRFKDAEGESREFYLLLVQSAQLALENGLRILGMQAPEKM